MKAKYEISKPAFILWLRHQLLAHRKFFRCSACMCPVAQYIEEREPPASCVSVTGSYASIGGHVYQLPDWVRCFVRAYDSGHSEESALSILERMA